MNIIKVIKSTLFRKKDLKDFFKNSSYSYPLLKKKKKKKKKECYFQL